MTGNNTFEKVINALKMNFIKAENIQVLKPVMLQQEKHQHNRLMILHRGKASITTPNSNMLLHPNQIYFIPATTVANVTYGAQPIAIINKEDTDKDINNYLQVVDKANAFAGADTIITIIDFNVEAYNAIDFFSFIEIPIFEIEGNEVMHLMIQKILEENKNNQLGKIQLLNSNLISLIINILRYIVDKKMFLQKIGFKIEGLADARLVNIFSYVTNHLYEKLSNEEIAKHVDLSREYIGQFFKKTTHMKLQEYIKTIRLNKAVEIITTTNKKIQDVCKEVGITDFAYFCRIFKKVIGTTAKKVQQR